MLRDTALGRGKADRKVPRWEGSSNSRPPVWSWNRRVKELEGERVFFRWGFLGRGW